jgi:hypothetical protein
VSYNPWGKKNPFLSMWLSGANAMFGATRNQVTAAMHRQTAAAVTEGTRQVLAFWGMDAPVRKRKLRGAEGISLKRSLSRRARRA